MQGIRDTPSHIWSRNLTWCTLKIAEVPKLATVFLPFGSTVHVQMMQFHPSECLI